MFKRKLSKTWLTTCVIFTFFSMCLPFFANAETTRIITERYYYIGFDYDSTDVIIERVKTAHIDGILAGKRELNSSDHPINDAKIQEIQAQGIQVFLLWQATNDNNNTRECTLTEMKTRLDCRFWDVSNQDIADVRIAQLQDQLNEFPSLNGIQLEEPTIELTDPLCSKITTPGPKTYAALSPKLTIFLQRVRNTLPANMHFSMNSPSLAPFGDAKYCAGLDFVTLDSLGVFDFISLQTGGTTSVTSYMQIVNGWKAKFPNTFILPIVYGWDAGLGGTMSRLACLASCPTPPCYGHRDCWNNDFLNAIYNIQVINNSRVGLTQVHWSIWYEWINDWSSYPCLSGTWGLACAVGGIPLPALSNRVSFPTFTPSPNLTYTSAQDISIFTSTEDDIIRYTKDGTDPTEASLIYTAPITISSTTTIKAKAFKTGLEPSNIATAKYNICIEPDCVVTFTSISVSPSSTSVLINGTQSLSAIAKDQFNNPMTGITFTWTSSNSSVATVNSSGLVTGKILGSATITALSGSLSATAALTVSATAPAPTCADNQKNGDETGIDCGGSCPACHLPPPPTPCDGIVCDNPGSCQVGPGKCEATSSAAYVCVYPDDPAYCDDLDGKVCTVDRCLSKDGGLTSSCSTGPDACKGLIPCGRLVDDPTTTNIIESNPCTLCAMIYMVQMIIEFLVKIAAVLAMLSITFGGFLYIFAAGNQGTLEKAKSIIKYVLIGFIIILIAWAVIDSILAAAGYIDPIGGEWYMMNC
ncbi:chitobiase/beta-hexosaminidase C-terminal domain-containing protein [Candidatus Parcubacteria bacterium]|nr:chitobiase/beta-hexosaminidase C-terminal domain-containing protein [Candidatus Parcubacteria bacterium]